MSVVNKISGFNGLSNYLNGFVLGKPRNGSFRAYDEHINNILIIYCKEFNIEYIKNNNRGYKGNYQPVLDNAHTVQQNFKQFCAWINKNYDPKKLL